MCFSLRHLFHYASFYRNRSFTFEASRCETKIAVLGVSGSRSGRSVRFNDHYGIAECCRLEAHRTRSGQCVYEEECEFPGKIEFLVFRSSISDYNVHGQ